LDEVAWKSFWEGTDRIVKPVTIQRYKHYDVVAIDYDKVLFESGEIMQIEALTEKLPQLSPQIFVGRGIADFVANLHEEFINDPQWQWKVTTKERDLYLPEQLPQGTRLISTVVIFFGWEQKTYHLALDPIVFYGKRFATVWKIERSIIEELLAWGITLRDWCRGNNLGIRSTQGGISSQFLTSSRFYPEDRRKIPRSINQRARENLPGNYYRLSVPIDSSREYQGYYLDQRAAHHYHAERIRFPNANSLYARGRFLDLGDIVFPTVDSQFSGLYCLRLGISEIPGIRDFSPLDHSLLENTFDTFVWSSEIEWLVGLGYKIHGVIAAWGSVEEDIGLPKYAKWAQAELVRYSNASWLKPILLSTYGVLGMKPRQREIVQRRTRGKGKPALVLTGRNALYGLLVGATGKDKKLEPRITNVLHRGLIEAATRIESLGYAHYLANQGYNLLSIYADGVIIEDEGKTPLPFLPEPWRLQNTLHHLQFINKQAFISGEVSKLPGNLSRSDILPIAKSHRNPPVKVKYEALTGKPTKTTAHI